jgi:hypothetical protein
MDRERELYNKSCQWFLKLFLGAFANLRKVTIGFVVSVRPHRKTGRIFMKFDIVFSNIYQKRKFNFIKIWQQ